MSLPLLFVTEGIFYLWAVIIQYATKGFSCTESLSQRPLGTAGWGNQACPLLGDVHSLRET